MRVCINQAGSGGQTFEVDYSGFLTVVSKGQNVTVASNFDDGSIANCNGFDCRVLAIHREDVSMNQ